MRRARRPQLRGSLHTAGLARPQRRSVPLQTPRELLRRRLVSSWAVLADQITIVFETQFYERGQRAWRMLPFEPRESPDSTGGLLLPTARRRRQRRASLMAARLRNC